MDYKLLGRTGVRVSRLCFGTMSFGGDADEQESARMYQACRDAGINFFDCADQYNGGKSEAILGGLMRGHRDDLVLTTKCFNPSGPAQNARGNSRRHVRRAGGPGARGQGALPGTLEPRRMAHAVRARRAGAARLGAAADCAADVQPGEAPGRGRDPADLSLIHISEPTRL